MGANGTIYTGLSDLAADPHVLRQAQDDADIRAACEEGARGVSFRIDSPAKFDRKATVRALAIAREAGAPRCAVHLPTNPHDAIEGLEVAIDVAERAGVALHISHHLVARGVDGAMYRTLESISRAREHGISVTIDVYPYIATSLDLVSLLPAGVTTDALKDPQISAAAALHLQTLYGERWHDFMLAEMSGEALMDWCGTRFDDIARAWRQSPARTVVQIIGRDAGAKAFFFCGDEEDVAAALSADFCSIGTDASALALDPQAFFGQPHPRAFGTFPRVFGRFVSQRGTLTLEEAVRRMTSLPAATFGIEERGEICEGAFADLVVFDAQTICDTATYERAVALPIGIDHVFVNGERVIKNGKPTSARPGRVLRGGRA